MGEAQRGAKCMAPRVVDVYERGGTAARAQVFVPKPMRRIVVMGEFVGRRNHCA